MSLNISQTSLFPVRRDKQIPIGYSFSGNTSAYYGGTYGRSITTDKTGLVKESDYLNMGLFSDGTGATPSIAFKFDTDTGFWRPGANAIGVSTGGVENFRFESDDFYAKGDIVGFSTYISDERLKDNIENIKDGLSTILKLNPVKFNFKSKSTKHYGMLAQQVKNIIPEIVVEHKLLSEDDTLYKTIRYQEIIPWLVKAIQEQQKQIHQLEQDLNYYKNCLY